MADEENPALAEEEAVATTRSTTRREPKKLDTEALRQEFEKFAAAEGEDEAKTLPVQHLTEVLGEIGLAELAAPKELAAFVKTVAANPMFLTFEETNAVCGLLSTPELAGSSNKYTITARRTYLETGHVATDDAILNFIQALEEHKRMCESEGKYMEARAAAKRIATVKMQEGVRMRKEMLARQEEELLDAEEAYQVDKEQQDAIWDEKINKYEEDLAEAVGQKKRHHLQQLEEFVAEVEKKRPSMPKFSKDLLIHRHIEGHLAKQGKYTKATRVKDAADRMEAAEMETTQATFDAELSLKEGKLRAKQQQELDALIQKGARGRDELEIASVQDKERRVQRYRNLIAELTNLHRLEVAHLENFLEGKAIAGKCDPMKESTFRRRSAVMPQIAMEARVRQ